jgi:hypothetical protein
MRTTRRLLAAAGAALLGAALGAAPAEAQQRLERATHIALHDGSVGLELPRTSPFTLYAEGDEGIATPRTGGRFFFCFTNITFGSFVSRHGCWAPAAALTPAGTAAQQFFDVHLSFAAGPGDMPSVIDRASSGLRGDGFTYNTTQLAVSPIGGGNKFWASDATSRGLLSYGVRVTNDASCTNRTTFTSGWLDVGFQLLPQSDCPPTFASGGWQGRRPIPVESYVALQDDPAMARDPFAFWRVPAELQDEGTFGGATGWQTYGEFSDHYFQALPRYGAVIPGQTGTPVYHGWPMGITVRFDAFYYALPALSGVVYWQATIVNESEKVYGQGFDYDSLYMAIQPNFNPSFGAHYFDPARSAWLANRTGQGCLGRAAMPGLSGCGNQPNDGFNSASSGFVVLKSPIGDQRYKLFTNPNSRFFDPAHPLRGDTITANHMNPCGFGNCFQPVFQRSMRSAYGYLSSQGIHVLDDRPAASLSAADYTQIFRPHDWPDRSGEFNRYVPGVDDDQPIWDYDKDGVPNAIYASNCGPRGCVELWGDTLPSGHPNSFGNVGTVGPGIGPFPLAAGDTAGFVVAYVVGRSAAEMDATVNGAISFYQNFFLGPVAAPTPRVVAADVVGGGVRQNEVTIYWDNAATDWVDAYLATLDVGADLALNPGLADQVRQRAANNVAALHIFKSCDGGTTYTANANCAGDPVQGAGARFAGLGWQPYATLTAAADGSLPNFFRDPNVVSGINYTYVLVTETRGAEFNLVRQGPAGPFAELVEFAPVLMSPLNAAATNPNVASVYVPLNLAAGAADAVVTIASRGRSTVPFNVNVIRSAPAGGEFAALMTDSVVVERREYLSAGAVDSTRTVVTTYQVRTGTAGTRVTFGERSFSTSAPVTVAGLTATAPVTEGNVRTTVWRGSNAMVLRDPQDRPLLVSATLTGTAATPGEFIARPDFPFFRVDVNRAQGGTWATSMFYGPGAREVTDTLPTRVAFSLRPRNPAAARAPGSTLTYALPGSQFGELEFTFAGDPFGAAAPFPLNRAGLDLQALFTSSVTGRPVASTSSADTALLRLVREADPSVTLPADSLRAYKLPFSVRNLTYDRDVTVLVTSRQHTTLLGQGLDTVRVQVPADHWMPGDEIHLVETVTRERRDAQGRTVFDPATGRPELETVPAATFKFTLGCNPIVPCDPTVGGQLASAYQPVPAGARIVTNYYVPFESGEEIRFQVAPAVRATDVAAADVDLRRVHVVPNPYIVYSQFERATTDRVLKFTNVPPSGRIRIFDVAGRFIQELSYTEQDLRGGDLDWNMVTREGLELAYGLYVFVLEYEGRRATGKFVVIR